jgi:hypothetical protein
MSPTVQLATTILLHEQPKSFHAKPRTPTMEHSVTI